MELDTYGLWGETMAAEIQIVVPAWNEGPRIAQVLETLCTYPQKKHIRVVDDGSTDDTAATARQFPVRVLSMGQNYGKGAALQRGLEAGRSSPYWLFLDADLRGLNHHHIDQLLEPLYRSADVGMAVGTLTGSSVQVNLAQRWFGLLNGERALAGFFVDQLPDLSWSRFGVEVFLSRLAAARSIPVEKPILKQLTHVTKEEKYGWPAGLRCRLQMYRECLYSLTNWKKYDVSVKASIDSSGHH